MPMVFRIKPVSTPIGPAPMTNTVEEVVIPSCKTPGFGHGHLNGAHGNRSGVKQGGNGGRHVIRYFPDKGSGENMHVIAKPALEVRRLEWIAIQDADAVIDRPTINEAVFTGTANAIAMGHAGIAFSAGDPRVNRNAITHLQIAAITTDHFIGMRAHIDDSSGEFVAFAHRFVITRFDKVLV